MAPLLTGWSAGSAAIAARKILARPVDDTLYFAAEAAALDGKSATVDGAIASGIRAAELILEEHRARPR